MDENERMVAILRGAIYNIERILQQEPNEDGEPSDGECLDEATFYIERLRKDDLI